MSYFQRTQPWLRFFVAASFLSAAFLDSARSQTTFEVALVAGNCLNCHVSDVKAATSIPVIVGKPEAVLKAQLMAYKSDNIPAGTTIMNRLAKGYSDAEIAALAAYFSTLDPKGVASAGAKK